MGEVPWTTALVAVTATRPRVANEQVMPAGNPEQEKVIVLPKPVRGVMVTPVLAEFDCPDGGCGMVKAGASSARVKSFTVTAKVAVFTCPLTVPATCTV